MLPCMRQHPFSIQSVRIHERIQTAGHVHFTQNLTLKYFSALKDLNTEALLEDAGATLLKNITLYQQQ